uniref:Protein kinase n=1 Tax=Pithovirus LCPAC101 TaxID=2506586 RepID=A0A481Z339_9VIRU|nr:MAG: hypothetical protein LCPAC101_01470 [Pithovirus LCPAC101]
MYSITINLDNKINKIEEDYKNLSMDNYDVHKLDKLISILPEYRTTLSKTDQITPIMAEEDHGASIYSDNGKKYFIKYGWYSSKDLNEITNEALILNKLNNPHIPKLIAYTNNIENKLKIKDSTISSLSSSSRGIECSNDITGLIMVPFIKGIDLKLFIKENKDISISTNIFKQIIYLLYEMNTKYKFTHYDLHNSNIMIETLDNPTTIHYESLDMYITTSHYVWMIDFGYSYANIRDINNKKIGIYQNAGFIYREQWWIHDIFKLFMFTYDNISPSHIKHDLSYIENNILPYANIFEYREIDEAIIEINTGITKYEKSYKLDLSSYLNNINNLYNNYNKLIRDIDEDDFAELDDVYDEYIGNIPNIIENMSEYIVNKEKEKLNDLYSTPSYINNRKLIENIMLYFKIIINKRKSTLEDIIKFYSKSYIYDYYAVPFGAVDDKKDLIFYNFVKYINITI